MSALIALTGATLLAEGPSDGGQGFTPTNVTPGVTGFVVVFLLGLATVLLILDMTRRVRRVQARERVAERHRLEDERLDAEFEGRDVPDAPGDGIGGSGAHGDDRGDVDPGRPRD